MANILIIEDDSQFRAMLEQMLKQDGHQVTSAENGEVGLNIYPKLHPDLVITDILMPKKDGIEVILGIRQQSADTKIIAISGGRRSITADFNLASAQLIGVNAVLSKPFSRVELQRVINNVLSG